MGFLLRLLPNRLITKRYVNAGEEIGDKLRYQPLAKILGSYVFGLEESFNRWKRLEEEYARRGFRTISLDDFINPLGKKIEDLKGIRRGIGEEVVLHSRSYREIIEELDRAEIKTVYPKKE